MKFLKNNLKLIIGLMVGAILASTITVYAYSYFAKDISYTKPGTNTAISVETALNELYNLGYNREIEFICHEMMQTCYTIEQSGSYYIVVTSYSSSGQSNAKGYTTIESVTNGTFEEISSKGGG